jgi:cytochrome c oxidase subunit 2
MFGFYIVLAIFLILAILLLIFRVTRLVNVVKGSEEKVSTASNNINAILMVVFMVVFFGLMAWYSWVNFDAYDPPVASDHGIVTDRLFWRTMWITVIVFVITHILLFVFAYKYRYQANRRADFYPHNNKLELLWTGVPAIVLTWLVISGWMAWSDITKAAPDDAEQIEIMGYQFAWSLRYGGMDNEVGDYDYRLIDAVNSHGQDFSDRTGFDDFQNQNLVIPKGKPVLLKIRARDVLHSVFIPHMRLKMDAMPGMPTQFWFVANKTTEEIRVEEGNPDFNYELACTEVCGSGHFSMKKTVTVLEQADYDKWKAEQKSWLSKNPDYMSQVPENLRELAVVTAGINE